MNALKLYRISRFLYLHHIPLLPRVFSKLSTWLYACKVPYKMHIGKNTKFAAGGLCLNINGDSIGDNCVIGTGCVFMRSFPYKEKPKVGNNVYISHGVKLVGNIIIEDNVMIGANSVVTKSVPKNAIVVGIPAKIIGYTTDLDYDPFENEGYKEGWKPFLEDKRANKA